jgi:cytoskeletal protein RodZ
MSSFVTKKIGKRRTLGSILKAARSRLGVSLEEVEAATRIHIKHLLALEAGNYHHLPAEAYNVGFVRSYAEFLRLNPEKVVTMYREERSTKRLSPIESGVTFTPKRVGNWQFLITPKVLGILGTVLLFGSVGVYIYLQLRSFAQPPELVITNVPSEFTSTKDTVKLVGSASGGATVSINSEPILVTGDGSFSQIVQLSPGLNSITVLAHNRVNKETQRSVKVLYNPNLAQLPQSGTTD